ncbi:HTH-type transcriptional regulator GbpR [Saliniradius amylolyticus]|uniref:HTH-type transcriptional regulator GbpR n=1 Tax=Saliniradius amylolyticus TaxID=2183582 RepID=A0A2S2E6C2_9ALTE|nr:LysR family transcriptional regulator [Saliniradius amylolyticus]AWL13191.1 HTH-type transcriptional regulator GbpR [Saliniradius amylolyticus]
MAPEKLQRDMIARMKLKHLKLLVTVGEQCNIFKAAQLMNMAQPAATKIIRDIENTYELQLFNRTSRGVIPTLYGEVLIRHAKLVLSQIKHVSEELTSLQSGLSGHVTVGTLITASLTLLPKALVRLRAERPNVYITVVEGTQDRLLPSLVQGDLDMVVGRLPEHQDYDGLTTIQLYEEPAYIVARSGHPLSNRGTLELADIVNESWILPSPQTYLRRELDQSFRDQGLPSPQPVVESVSVLTNRTLLTETDMIAVMPGQVFHQYEKAGELCRLPVPHLQQLGPVGITMRSKDNLTPAAHSLMEDLQLVSEELI